MIKLWGFFAIGSMLVSGLAMVVPGIYGIYCVAVGLAMFGISLAIQMVDDYLEKE